MPRDGPRDARRQCATRRVDWRGVTRKTDVTIHRSRSRSRSRRSRSRRRSSRTRSCAVERATRTSRATHARDATHVHQRLGRDRARYDIEWNKNQRKRCGGERLGQRRAKVRARANFDAHHGARIRRDRLRGVSAFSFGIATDDDDGWFLARRARRLQSELMSLMVRARSRARRR